jgi:hypothetical protein
MMAARNNNQDITADLRHPSLHLLKLLARKRATIKLKRL